MKREIKRSPLALGGGLDMRYRVGHAEKRSGITVAIFLAILAVARLAFAA